MVVLPKRETVDRVKNDDINTINFETKKNKRKEKLVRDLGII